MAKSVMNEDILEEYEKHGSLYKTAKQLGVLVTRVKMVVEEAGPREAKPDISECKFDGFGDPDKRQFLVDRMLATSVWDNEIPEVAAARKAFEEGTHNLGTGRDGPFILLYSFPQIVKTPRPGYFNLTMEA